MFGEMSKTSSHTVTGVWGSKQLKLNLINESAVLRINTVFPLFYHHYRMTQVFMFMPPCIPPVLRWLTAHQDQLNSSTPCSSRSEPAYSRGCAGWVPLIGTHSCGGRCCPSGGTAGKGEGRRGYSSWKERHPTGTGRPRYSGYDWRQRREGGWENRW